MLSVKLKDADALGDITVQLEVVTYLQGLLLYDNDGKSVLCEDFEHAYGNACNYLWHWQCEIALRLKKLMDKDDFMARPGTGLST